MMSVGVDEVLDPEEGFFCSKDTKSSDATRKFACSDVDPVDVDNLRISAEAYHHTGFLMLYLELGRLFGRFLVEHRSAVEDVIHYYRVGVILTYP